MNSLSFCYLLFAFTLTEIGHGLSTKKQVTFPLKSIDNKDHDFQQLRIAFQDMVDSSDLFVQTSPLQKRNNVCSVPALGSDVMVKFQANDKNNEIENSAFHDDHSNESLMPSEFVLSVEASGKDDFGWICVKFYDNKELFQDIVDISGLHEAVIDHFNKQPPHPGFDANSAKLAGSREIQDLFENPQSAMGELEKNGFLILSNGPKSTQIGHEKLTQYLVEKTNQAKHVRTDKVHFLSRDQASYCGFEEHFDILMGIASFLNDNLNFQESSHLPINPATKEQPLTIPSTIQLAEYGENDFYKAHSDNSPTKKFVNGNQQYGRVRSNFRHYTCILYCNDDWKKEQDGGVLRLYPNTRNLQNADDAILNNYDFIDVSPHNGHLIVFDSCLIHSVEKVTHKSKKRRAMTLWISRPNDSGVEGELYF